MKKSYYQKLIKSFRTHRVETGETAFEVVKMVDGSRAKVFGKIVLTFQLAQCVFREPFFYFRHL